MVIQGQVESGTLFTFTVNLDSAKKRLDRYLADHFTDYSRSFFQKLIDQGSVSINNKPAIKHGTTVFYKDSITVQFPLTTIIKQQKMAATALSIPIIAQTDHFMIINKPASLLVHAPSHTSSALTLADWILHNHDELAHIGVVDRPGIIHRLDKETSGVLIITRTNYAHELFGALFRKRDITKTYLALVEGHPPKEGTINLPIGRNPFNRIKMTTFNEKTLKATKNIKIRSALTHYTVLEYFSDAALVQIKPVTGRTHQIRVHMAAIGYPIIGDQLYGKKSVLIDRHALHAHHISFMFEDIPYAFSAEIPDDMKKLISVLPSQKN